MDKNAVWTERNLAARADIGYRHFPTEYMLRAVFASHYFGSSVLLGPGTRVLDVGCLYANNFAPFSDRGCELYGIEINPEMVALAKQYAAKQGIRAEIREGTNCSLPFPDNHFDLLLSIVTIHYEDNMQQVRDALREFHRVLKPGGTAIISTAGREYDMLRTARALGSGRYVMNLPNDFRDGLVMTFFDSEHHFKNALADEFASAQVAVITESYPKSTMQFYVGRVTAKSP